MSHRCNVRALLVLTVKIIRCVLIVGNIFIVHLEQVRNETFQPWHDYCRKLLPFLLLRIAKTNLTILSPNWRRLLLLFLNPGLVNTVIVIFKLISVFGKIV